MQEDLSRYCVLGVEIDPLTSATAATRIVEMIERREGGYIVFCTVSTIVTSAEDPELMRALEEASLVTPDGMPLVWLGRKAGFPTERVYGPDFLLAFLARTGGRYRHYLYGGAPGVAEKMADRLRSAVPSAHIVGTYSPPFDAQLHDQDAWELERVRGASPDVVWVGLGHPRQEKWMRLHHQALGGAVTAGVGAAFDFLSGEKKEAPAWIKKAGLQWAHRLFLEPRRLWRRYLIGNSRFLAGLIRERIRVRRTGGHRGS